MKLLIVFACALVVAVGNYTTVTMDQHYRGPQDISVIGKNEAAVDSLMAKRVKATPLAQVVTAKTHGDQYSKHTVQTPIASYHEKYVAPAHVESQHDTGISKSRVPVHTIELMQKTQGKSSAVHKYVYDESAAAYEHDVPVGKVQEYGFLTHISHTPVKSHKVEYVKEHAPAVKGVPLNTTEAQSAEAVHLAVHAEYHQ